jgi:cell division protein FtsB
MIQLLLDKKTYYILGVILLFLGGVFLGYKLGIGKFYAYQLEVTQAMTEERDRIDAANRDAKRKEAERILEYNKNMDELKRQIRELEDEADKDPDANRPALSGPSVMRINKVRVPKNNTDSR